VSVRRKTRTHGLGKTPVTPTKISPLDDSRVRSGLWASYLMRPSIGPVVRPVDIPSLKSAAQSALGRRPVRLAIDLAEVNSCNSEGIRWILETRQRIARCGGELRVVVLPDGPIDRLIELNGIDSCDRLQLPAFRR
jgi:hypothetical protein